MKDQTACRRFAESVVSVFGISLGAGCLASFRQLYELLAEANKTANLTRITAIEDFYTRHLLDSLTLAPFLTSLPPDFTLMDVGSGAGFPALPLAVVFPHARMTAAESVRKKARFIEQAAEALGLTNITVLAERSEHLGQNPAYREQFDAVTARAVAPLNILSELCLPLVKVHGHFLAMKTGTAMVQELPAAQAAIAILGGSWVTTQDVSLPELPNRAVVVIAKAAPTPGAYPRHPGLPEKKPLEAV